MLLVKLIIVSLCCHLSYTASIPGDEEKKPHLQQQQTTEVELNKKDISTPHLTPVTQSNIYRIKRLNISKDKGKQTKTVDDVLLHQEEPHQQALNGQDTSTIHQPLSKTTMKKGVLKGTFNAPNKTKTKIKKVKSLTKNNAHGLNRKLLNKLGFTKVKAPNSHNRKRLAIESRRHASPDDSHMFIIKLPPNMYYYANPKSSSSSSSVSPNALTSSGKTSTSSLSSTSTSLSSSSPMDVKSALKLQLQDDITKNDNGKKVSFPFNSNGKPGRIYHWNLPVIKKMLEEKQQRFPSLSNLEPNKVQQLIDIKNIPTWSKPWENESIEKSYQQQQQQQQRHHHHHHHELHQQHQLNDHQDLHQDTIMMSYKKSLKRKSPSYYAPANTVNKNSFNKYFPGNGKPKGFYVIKENQKKPMYYKNIVA